MIGNHVIISWECQIFDTNFHYMEDKFGDIYRKDGEIFIGNNVWIANRVTIAKGAKIPNDSIIASNSLVNKDLSDTVSGLYAGCPAKLVKENVHAVFSLEGQLNEYFRAHPEKYKINRNE